MAKRTERICTGFLPVPAWTLTPRAAQQWLERSEWHETIRDLSDGADAEESDAIGELGYWVGEMTRACARAIRTGRPVDLDSNLDPRSHDGKIHYDVRSLSLLLRAMHHQKRNVVELEGLRAEPIRQIAGAIVRLCDSAAALEQERDAAAKGAA